ncbi:MAG: amino acid transporter [Bacteroidetes bacterium]|jgi:amino acid transporter/mannitol/fructose-specific phosphotransferase system IIA component (Ntr-type)|nr:amino acid transporter [Bacteroidota bacterium]MAC06462.1 amino acid transporter [Balneola sp.]MAO78656.1 amino acid transporter [Balneola sp.]MBF63116.1 amino acid transporter [Balneola sp.]HCI72170.1 amino acid transporter [Balneola sp.]|tara:strand:+ start:21650 stop:23752 length:2103 start_codon:yes stop_codon:yes gene_type:complete
MKEKLSKELGLSDVYAIATGAMFSSGFFLLPGLAAAETGPSVFLAYLVSGIIVLPTMFSVAELATAMPKSGGTYYIIDRSLGPMFGTIGGFGSWIALVLKSAFALIGMGAYLAIFFDVPMVPIAVILTVVFGILNVVGAKETTFLQKILVAALITIMIFYVIQGLVSVLSPGLIEETKSRFTPLFIDGYYGFFATVGMVFVSYAGLTKVASIAEEVKNPDRNLPLGMFLAIITAVFVYVVGVFIMVSVLDPNEFREDLTPVASAGEVILTWLPESVGLILVVIAAVAAFASTGNAGIMSASRYPMAMARDKLLNERFATIGKLGTPHWSILATVIMMVIILVAFNVAEVAKLASAFQLLLFGFLNLAVIVMRESKIKEYDPGFNSPFYPWVQIIGIILSIVLIFEMGVLSILFTIVVSVFSVIWYKYYAEDKVDRQGAIFHVHARLGQNKDLGLEVEMRGILKEKGLRSEDQYEEMISRAAVLDIQKATKYSNLVKSVAGIFSERLNKSMEELAEVITEFDEDHIIPISNGVALNHARIPGNISPEMVLVRIKAGMQTDNLGNLKSDKSGVDSLHAIIYLVSSQEDTGQHLRMLAQIAEKVGVKNFIERWNNAEDEGEMREILLRDERFIRLVLKEEDDTNKFIGKMIKDVKLPGQSLITIIYRNGDIKIPHGITVLQGGDELSIIGNKEDINDLKKLTK